MEISIGFHFFFDSWSIFNLNYTFVIFLVSSQFCSLPILQFLGVHTKWQDPEKILLAPNLLTDALYKNNIKELNH